MAEEALLPTFQENKTNNYVCVHFCFLSKKRLIARLVSCSLPLPFQNKTNKQNDTTLSAVCLLACVAIFLWIKVDLQPEWMFMLAWKTHSLPDLLCHFRYLLQETQSEQTECTVSRKEIRPTPFLQCHLGIFEWNKGRWERVGETINILKL